MIRFIRGRLAHRQETMIEVEQNGIGYEMEVPGSVIQDLPAIGDDIKVYTELYVREDILKLYGFLTRDDLDIFKKLLTVNGVGPKAALAILSTLTPEDLRFAIVSDDVKSISKAKGIGKKTAQKLILDLKDKMPLPDPDLASSSASTQAGNPAKTDALQALMALGYSQMEAGMSLKHLDSKGADTETLIKDALKQLAKQ